MPRLRPPSRASSNRSRKRFATTTSSSIACRPVEPTPT
jgi:hypothetical protein